MKAYTLRVPAAIETGETSGGDPVHFDCAGCGAKGPEIKGYFSEDGTLDRIGAIDKEGRQLPAVFCEACWALTLEDEAGQAEA